MRQTYSILLNQEQKAIFPDRCIVSHAKPDSVANIYRTRTPLLSLIVLWLPFLVFFLLPFCRKIQVPIVKKRKCMFELKKCITLIVLLSLVFAGLFTYDALEINNRLLRPLFVIVFIIPVIIWEMYHPESFDYTIHKDTIEYAFSHLGYAKDFARLNHGVVVNADDVDTIIYDASDDA